MMKQPTIRPAKIKKNSVKIRLIIFGTLAVLLIVCSLFSEYLAPCDPYLHDLSIAKAAPSPEHIFGTDRYGRDVLSRVIVGSRTSIFSALLLVTVITVIGTAIGVLCGWHGGMPDSVLMRISDIFLACPHSAKPDSGAKGDALHPGCTALRQRHGQYRWQAHPAKYHWLHTGHVHAGYRHDDDGAGWAFFPWTRR